MSGMYADNDGQFPDETPVMVKFPLTGEQEKGDRKDWPWLPGTVMGQCGHDEWHVVVDGVEELAEPSDDGPDVLLYPACFRDSSEIRRQVSDSPSEEGIPLFEEPDCSCEYVDIGIGWQKVAEDPECPRCTPLGRDKEQR